MWRGAADPQIGVVIPVYNRAQTLQATLSFVERQTRPPTKLVVVDDGSSDETASAAEKWLSRVQQPFTWSVIRAPHRTAAFARNIGFSEVGNLPLVAFLDSDDLWPCDFLERTSARLIESPGAAAVSTDREFFNADGGRWGSSCAGTAADPVTWLFLNDAGIASCSLFRSNVIRQAGGWNESLESGADFDLFIEVAQAGTWLHEAGEPVRFNRSSERAFGEEGNLSLRRLEMFRDWAVQYENAYAEICRRTPGHHRLLRKGIARKWKAAGDMFLQSGRAREAADAFAAAVSWKPSAFKPVIRRAFARLRARRDAS